MKRVLRLILIGCFSIVFLNQGYAQTLVATGPLTNVSTTYGTASSAPTSFTLSNTGNLGGGSAITITAPAGFEVSFAAGSGYGTSINATATGVGNVPGSASPVYVRLAPATSVGTYSGNVTIADGAVSTTIAAASSTVSPLALTITGATASNKVYDGTTSTSVAAGPTLNGVLAGDVGNVSIAGGATGTFASANVGSGISVTTSGYSISGTASGNYTLTQPTLSADITAKALTVTGVTASNKTYDGTNSATLNNGAAALSGVVAGDVGNVTLNSGAAVGTFANANVGTGKTVTTSGYAITGTAAGNYSLTQPTPTADITAVTLTITGVTASNRIYDGTTTAALGGSPALSGVLAGDVGNVTLNSGSATGALADKNVGTR